MSRLTYRPLCSKVGSVRKRLKTMEQARERTKESEKKRKDKPKKEILIKFSQMFDCKGALIIQIGVY